jgi:hypothetical protein
VSAKDIVLRPIPAADARRIVEREHYSGKVVQNSQIHIGVFYGGALEGAMQFGPSLDKRKVGGLVSGTEWHEFTELNRMAFSERLPRNSESRALSVALRLLRKHAPQVKWVVSFADGAQCGDGTIYRAAGFVLTGIKENDGLFFVPGYGNLQRMTLEVARMTPIQAEIRKRLKMPTQPAAALVKALGGKPIPGYQFRYVYFQDPAWRSRLTVPVIPYDQIPASARMYRGEKMCGSAKATPSDQPGIGGASPTLPLLPPEVADV